MASVSNEHENQMKQNVFTRVEFCSVISNSGWKKAMRIEEVGKAERARARGRENKRERER